MDVNTKISNMTKKAGRPLGRKQDRLVQMRLSEEFITKIDEWRRHQPDLPSRTEAVRRMVEQALSQGKKR